MNIESYCGETEFGLRDIIVNKQIAGLLSVMIKKKEEKQYDNTVPVICSPIQFNNDKYHYGNKLYCLLKMENRGCHSGNRYDVILTPALSPDKINNIIYQNNISQYNVCENTGDVRSDNIPANVISAEKPDIIPVKSTPAESIQAEHIQEEYIRAEYIQEENAPAEYRPGSDCTDAGVRSVQAIAPVLPALPVFRISDVIPERKYLPLWQYAQEKMPQILSHTGTPPGGPESSRPDYYCYYYFRQKHQPPEPVLIYREKPGRFKLETGSEPLNRRLKTMNAINGIDSVDIL